MVNGLEFNNSMPVLPLSDSEIADALTYVYNSFGNSGQEITTQDAQAARGSGKGVAGVRQAPRSGPPKPSPYE